AVLVLADLLGMVPMAALAALLFIVAWNMSEARHFIHVLSSAPKGDVIILVICFLLTVVFDMVVAVAVGMGLASALFIRRMAELTHVDRIDADSSVTEGLPAGVAVYDINGPLFFGVSEKALTSLRLVDPRVRIIIVDMRDVPTVDGTAIVALQALISELNRAGTGLILSGLPSRIIVKLRRAGIRKQLGTLTYSRNMQEALLVARRWQGTHIQHGEPVSS